MWNRFCVLMAAIAFAGLTALSLSSAHAGDVLVARAKNPCSMRGNPCSMKANPCSMRANPCNMKNPCSSSRVIPLRARAIKGRKTLARMGRRLWKDKSLGTSGFSCNTCHPGGAGLKKKPYPKYIKMPNDIVTMDQMINYCVLNPMKGKALPWNSQKMTALAGYIASHSRGGSPAMNPCNMKGNPCSMKGNPCSMRNPCSMKGNPCSMRNPCSKKANPCSMKRNPCFMKRRNPCSR